MLERGIITALVACALLAVLPLAGSRLQTTFCHVRQAWTPLLVCRQ